MKKILLTLLAVSAFAATISFNDLTPDSNDSSVILQQKLVAATIANTAAVTNSSSSVGMDTTAIDTAAEFFAIMPDFTGSGNAVRATSPTITTPTVASPTVSGLETLTGQVQGQFGTLTFTSATNVIWDIQAAKFFALTLSNASTRIIITNWPSDSTKKLFSYLTVTGDGSRSLIFENSDLTFGSTIATNNLTSGETDFEAQWTRAYKQISQSPDPLLAGGTSAFQAQIDAKQTAVQAEESIASATTTSIGGTTSRNVLITGTTTITGFGTIASGTTRSVRMEGALTLTYNATSLKLPTSVSITTAANDYFVARSEGSGNWRVLEYYRADGTALSSAGAGTAFQVLFTPPGSSVPIWVATPAVEEFLGTATASTFGWTSTVNAGSAGSGTIANANSVTGTDGHFGQFSLGTATFTNAQAYIRVGQGMGVIGAKTTYLRWIIKTPTALSSATDAYQIWVGFTDITNGNADPTDGALFSYTHTLNSGIWTCRTFSNTSPTTATGGSNVTVVGGTWYYLDIVANSTSVDFYIASDSATPGIPGAFTYAGSCTATIPSAVGRETGIGAYIAKQAGSTGTTTETMFLDRCVLVR